MEYKIVLSKYGFDINELANFFGANNKNVRIIEKTFNCEISGNAETLLINCNEDDQDKINRSINKLARRSLSDELTESLVNEIIQSVINDEDLNLTNYKYVTTNSGKAIYAKNKSQAEYYELLNNNTIVFAMGAAGTGKTYLAVAFAIGKLKTKEVSKIIITRPIVEAGENLGFLPGELKEKVDPYLTPIYDAFYDILGKENTEKYIERGIIEIAPLAYMRGRTLTDAYVILDEAQNTTSSQMKMFLTRLGYNSKMAITGDESQIDLKSSVKSGIVEATNILSGIEDIAIIRFSNKDVVRNPLVSKIIEAYEKEQNY